MIPATQLNDISPHVKARGKTMRVKTLAFDSYLVTPREKGKLQRLVHFDVSSQGVVRIECVSLDGELCPANGYSKMCSHVESAVRRLERNIRKEEARQSTADLTLKRSKRLSKAVKRHPAQKRLRIA
jgi:hypothetical protein